MVSLGLLVKNNPNLVLTPRISRMPDADYISQYYILDFDVSNVDNKLIINIEYK